MCHEQLFDFIARPAADKREPVTDRGVFGLLRALQGVSGKPERSVCDGLGPGRYPRLYNITHRDLVYRAVMCHHLPSEKCRFVLFTESLSARLLAHKYAVVAGLGAASYLFISD